MSNVYLAARYSRNPEMQEHAKELQSLGHNITSRWIWGEHQALDTDLIDNPQLAMRFAREDIDDLLAANVIISFTEDPRTVSTRGGRHIELGIALATRWRYLGLPQYPQLRLIVVGPIENIFHALPEIERYESWQEAIKCLL